VRGFGFVTFASSDEALRARDALDGTIHAGRSISVRPFSSEPPKRGERMDGRSEAPAVGGGGGAGGSEDRTLYVGNLPYDTSQQELTQFLTEVGVGPIARIHLPVGPDGRMRGFGFVTLGNAEAAQASLSVLNGAEVRGRRLMVNIAHPRGDRPSGFAGAGAGGGGFDRSRPPMRSDGPRYPTEPPMNFEGGGGPPPEHRRTAPAGGGGGETDWSEEAKKKKKKKGAGAAAGRPGEERKRGGGGNWKPQVDYDDED
jgi:RNA recognition motif-containing protein